MPGFTRRGLACLAASYFFPLLVQAYPPDALPKASITGITLERGCFGCATGSSLVLRRDGSAIYTVTGNARSGTTDAVSKGMVPVKDFDELATLAVAQRFFELSDTYEDPQTRDGPWTTTGVARGELEKRVFRRDEAGPPALKAFEAAIEALRARIMFVPEVR